jgi:hypothetical protein
MKFAADQIGQRIDIMPRLTVVANGTSV